MVLENFVTIKLMPKLKKIIWVKNGSFSENRLFTGQLAQACEWFSIYELMY